MNANTNQYTASIGTTVVHNTCDYMSRSIRKETLEGETQSSRTFIYDGCVESGPWNQCQPLRNDKE